MHLNSLSLISILTNRDLLTVKINSSQNRKKKERLELFNKLFNKMNARMHVLFPPLSLSLSQLVLKALRKQIIQCSPLQIASCPNVSQKSLKPQCLSPYDTF